MGLFDLFSSKQIDNLNLSEKLEKIGYFDLIENPDKKKFIKEKIDFDFNDDSNQYIGKGWLTFPNDYYISSFHNLTEYKNGSPTSDFRAFEVWASSLFRGEFLDYLKSAKVVYDRNGIKLDIGEEVLEDSTIDNIHHKITINEREYLIFSGEASRDGQTMIKYLNTFRDILNDVVKRQNKDYKVILVTQPECVMFVLLPKNMLIEFKTIVKQTKNKIEE